MLRRIVANLRRQDWMAVAIELIVVVVGVFIGVQASNWNEQLATNRKAAVFTERLKADLRLESWNYENMIAYERQVRASAEASVDALTGNRPLPDGALLTAAFRATQYAGTVRYRATYDELTSTGELGLIRDRALPSLATRVYTSTIFDYAERTGQSSEYRRAFRMLISPDVQEQLRRRCGDRAIVPGDFKGLAHRLVYPCSTGLPADVIAKSVSLLRGDPGLVPLLRLRTADADTNIGNFGGQQQSLRDGLRAIARENP